MGTGPDDVVIFWDGRRRFDILKLSADGKTMSGHPNNVPTRPFVMTRLDATGTWTYEDTTVTLNPDGTGSRAGSDIAVNWKMGDGPNDVIIFWDGFRRFDDMKLSADVMSMSGHPNNIPDRPINMTRVP